MWLEGLDDEYPNRRFEQNELIAYLAICRSKAVSTIAGETPESLAGPSGFSWFPFTRAELHLYNIRHAQHHTGQLSAALRRLDESMQDPKAVRWVSSGWK